MTGAVCTGLVAAGRLGVAAGEDEATDWGVAGAGETESSKSLRNTGTACGVRSREVAVMLGVDSGVAAGIEVCWAAAERQRAEIANGRNRVEAKNFAIKFGSPLP
jgi:hypothetical protein